VVNPGQAPGVATIADGVEQLARYAFVKSCGCNVVPTSIKDVLARPVPRHDIA
jgi:EAL domain-containing protein (putative c-di-GMP-specific phosphodiesterase class I)